jgi:uncharacterized protein YjiS (DUF1127 family)
MRLIKTWTARRERRATEKLLKRLDPHILRDIGLDQGPISAEFARLRRERYVTPM